MNYVTARDATELLKLTAILMQATIPTLSRANRIVVLGDSRSSYGGAGYTHNPLEGYRNWQRYGNHPEISMIAPGTFGSFAVDPDTSGVFCAAGSNNNGSATQKATAERAYGYDGNLPFMAKHAAGVYQPFNYVCNHDAFSCGATAANVPRTNTYFQRNYNSLALKAEVFLSQIPTGSASTAEAVLFWQNLQREDGTHGPLWLDLGAGTSRITASGTINTASVASVQGDIVNMGTKADAELVRSYLTPGFTSTTTPMPATWFPHFIVGSNHATNGIEVVGLLVRTPNTAGLGVHYSADGGLKATDIINSRGNSYKTLSALRAHAISVRYGYNDANAGVTAAQFKIDVQALVDWIKANVIGADGVNPPLIMLESPYNQTGLSAPNALKFDGYGAVLAQIASTNAGVVAMDIRAATDAAGFNTSTHMADPAHANEAGNVIVTAARNAMYADIESFIYGADDVVMGYQRIRANPTRPWAVRMPRLR